MMVQESLHIESLKNPLQNSTTNVLTATTLIYATGAGITAAAGTRLALQLLLADVSRICPFQSQSINLASLFLVTTSQSLHWVICAPAAILRCGSCFSSSLSGIEPQFPVIRRRHERTLPSHQADRSEILLTRQIN